MAKFVTVTNQDASAPVRLNLDHIQLFGPKIQRTEDGLEILPDGAVIELAAGGSIVVTETPDELEQLFNNA